MPFRCTKGVNTDRNTVVTNTDNVPLQLAEDDCVRVTGEAGGSAQFSNAFGGTISAVSVDADSVEKIDCSSVINPANKVVTIEETQEDNGIRVTLHKMELFDKNTRVFLTVENNDEEEISFYDFNAKAFQGNEQFGTTYSFDVDYPEIESEIPPGIQENGVVIFEPIDPSISNTNFVFEARKGFSDASEFEFNVSMP